MKQLLSLLLLCPMLAIADDNTTPTPKPKANKWEVGLNTGAALSFQKGYTFHDDALFAGRSNISLYRNFAGSQVGARVEGGYSPLDESWYIAPEVVVNKTIRFNHLYIYGGGGVGYKRTEHSMLTSISYSGNGFTTGIQAGVVYHLGRHISVNGEAGIKSEQMWEKTQAPFTPGSDAPRYQTTNFSVYMPMSIGIRYRF
ncbi:MAG TPA: hypothetical protein VGD89_14230 [Flavipsychrobacter sp.]